MESEVTRNERENSTNSRKRTAWWICTGGRGYYQEWGKEAVEMTPDKAINIPAIRRMLTEWEGVCK